MSGATTRNTLFYWDTITIKVEDELFRVPKNDFVENSEVFADMFVMPSGNGQGAEGGDDEHPVFFEGYKKDDFISLLKVMYPSSRTLSADKGTVIKVVLNKEQWIGVLNLSTRWNMKKFRECAIHQLSTAFEIPPIEKILLARAHQVANWLEEGVTSLVEGTPKDIKDLSALNSWETIARILSMTMAHSMVNSAGPKLLEFALEQLKCNSCKTTFFRQSWTCCSCSTSISTGSALKLTTTVSSEGGTHSGFLSEVRCKSCSNPPWVSGWGYNCRGCNARIYAGPNVSYPISVEFGKIGPISTVKEMVDTHFGDEAKDYRITWPAS